MKQLVVAFSPDNEFGFKQVVLLEHKHRYALGFLTKEFTRRPRPRAGADDCGLRADQSPVSGDIVIAERSRATFPDITVEEGIRIFLTGGMALPPRIRGWQADDRVKEFRV